MSEATKDTLKKLGCFLIAMGLIAFSWSVIPQNWPYLIILLLGGMSMAASFVIGYVIYVCTLNKEIMNNWKNWKVVIFFKKLFGKLWWTPFAIVVLLIAGIPILKPNLGDYILLGVPFILLGAIGQAIIEAIVGLLKGEK